LRLVRIPLRRDGDYSIHYCMSKLPLCLHSGNSFSVLARSNAWVGWWTLHCVALRYVWRSNLNDIPFVRSSAIIYLSIYPSEPKPNYPVQYVSPSFLGMLFIFFFFFSFSSFLDTSSSDRWFVQSNHVIIWRPQGRHFAMGRILNRSIQMTAQLHTFGNRRIHILDFKVE
jgi:hypothetical protein